MTACPECSRRRAYMAADPELYRGDETRCDAHRPSPSTQGDSPVTDLAPCPGCGRADRARVFAGNGYYRARCVCGWCSPTARSASEAHAQWNRRAPALRWRSEPPDVAGWWWCAYRDDRRLHVVQVLDPSAYLTPGMVAHAKSYGIEWAGPIPEPEEGS